MAKPAPSANIVVEAQLKGHITALESTVGGDVLSFVGLLAYGADDMVRSAIEELHTRKRRGKKLCLVLETPGGYIDVVERLVALLRHHYRRVEFIIPNFAKSAGTVLVMSGDALHMDYFSVLGPIDPQIEKPDGKMVPALGYLAKYEELLDKSREGKLTAVEAAYLIERFDPAEMHQYEQSRNLTITLLKDWLVRYKFRTWKSTETRGVKVTRQMKVRRAAQIAELLNDTKKWHSHSRGISMEILRRKVGLRVEDFGANDELKERITRYYLLLKDYRDKRAAEGVIHTRLRFIPLSFHKRA
ncbi:MAG: serine dehydrogenasease [Candidatus Brocadiae bacterium]|nr:serine dehydrogenasease [Candidatus Brocadiia bacterium]